MTDPVTSNDLFAENLTDKDLHTAAVEAVTRAVLRRWPGDPIPVLRNARLLMHMALELGNQRAVVLAEGNHEDRWRLAQAVLATAPNHQGIPTDRDLDAADRVIASLLSPETTPVPEVLGG